MYVGIILYYIICMYVGIGYMFQSTGRDHPRLVPVVTKDLRSDLTAAGSLILSYELVNW